MYEWKSVKYHEPEEEDMSDFSYTETDIDEFDALYITIDAPPAPKKYPAHEHARKVVSDLSASHGLIYLLGTPFQNSEDSDQPIPFKQRRYFYYLTGVDFPDCAVTYDIAAQKVVLYIPSPDPKSVIWNGATPSKEECEENYEVDEVRYTVSLKEDVSRWRKGHEGLVYALHKDQGPNAYWLDDDRIDSSSLLPAMDAARVIKSKHEIELLRKACEVSSGAHRGVLKYIAHLATERHIETVFAASCTWRGTRKQAYGIIAASGPNAGTLHYVDNEDSLAGREAVLLDAGAEWKCYASDITRTWPVNGEWSKEGKETYDLVQEMQQRCLEAVKPGTTFAELQELSMEVGVKGLIRLGILCNGSYEEIKESEVGRVFYPHGLGHHIGLECHDVSSTATPRSTSGIPSAHATTASPPLEPNMVITIEPGIYFNPFALRDIASKPNNKSKHVNWELLQSYMKVGGVRIEDDVLVTETGHEVLSTAPKGDEALEIIKRSWAEKERDEKAGKKSKVPLFL